MLRQDGTSVVPGICCGIKANIGVFTVTSMVHPDWMDRVRNRCANGHDVSLSRLHPSSG